MQMKRYATTVGKGMVAGLAGATAMTVSKMIERKITSRRATNGADELAGTTPGTTGAEMIETGGPMGAGLVDSEPVAVVEPKRAFALGMLHRAIYAAAAGATYKALKRFEHTPTRMERMRGVVVTGAKGAAGYGALKAKRLTKKGLKRAKDSHLIDRIKELPIIERAA